MGPKRLPRDARKFTGIENGGKNADREMLVNLRASKNGGAKSELGTTQRFRPLKFQLLTPLLSIFVSLKGTLVLTTFLKKLLFYINGKCSPKWKLEMLPGWGDGGAVAPWKSAVASVSIKILNGRHYVGNIGEDYGTQSTSFRHGWPLHFLCEPPCYPP